MLYFIFFVQVCFILIYLCFLPGVQSSWCGHVRRALHAPNHRWFLYVEQDLVSCFYLQFTFLSSNDHPQKNLGWGDLRWFKGRLKIQSRRH